MKKSLVLLATLLFFSIDSFAQRGIRLKPDEFRKLSVVELKKDDRIYPKSFLYRMSKDSITLFCEVVHNKGEDPIYCRKKLSLKDFDYIAVSKRYEKLVYSLIGGAILGTAAYIGTKALTSDSVEELPNIGIFGKRANSGRIEAIIGGITGFGLGILIGEQFAGRKINLKKEQRKALRELKQHSYR